jgi:PhzF family phenazine biosynthesis protein
MKIDIYQVDAFTDTIFSGQNSAVCPLDRWIDDSLMQKIASETNLSKTAFFVKKDDGIYDIRWFAPKHEITLCDHAALASAYIIFNYFDQKLKKVTLHTLGDTIVIYKDKDLYLMSFPISMPTLYRQTNQIISLAFGVEPLKVLKDKDYILVYENEDIIKSLKPKIDILRNLDLRGVCITAKGDESDFVFKYFAPKLDMNEDLITGSIYSQLAPYWSQVLDNQKSLNATQLSKRKSELICDLENGNVIIRAKATLFMKGEIIIEERSYPRSEGETPTKLAIAV